MIVRLHPHYRKAYRQRIQQNTKLAKHVKHRIDLFLANPDHPFLRVHQLKGTHENFWSFSVTGDVRIIFQKEDDVVVIFYDIGTHNQVY